MVKGGYYHAGQVCVSTQRIFVHADLLAEFVDRFAARVRALRVGDPLSTETEVGPLILPREVDRVQSWIAEAVAGGARIVAGGERLSPTTFRPTVMVNVPAQAKLSREEVFGPVKSVYSFAKLDEAIAVANSLPFAFQASIFTRETGPALRAAERLDASAVMVNDHTAFRTDWMPFAGRRQSGYGIGGIPWSMREMTQEKMVVLRHSDVPSTLREHPVDRPTRQVGATLPVVTIPDSSRARFFEAFGGKSRRATTVPRTRGSHHSQDREEAFFVFVC